MRIKELFTIPEGTKVTEKMFGRVLLSSIFSILLCMVCLVSTTWAWFSVSVENTDNKIVLATVKTNLVITMSDGKTADAANGVYELKAGDYLLQAAIESDASEADAFGERTNPVYLIMTVVQGNETKSFYVLVDSGSAAQSHNFSISAGDTARVTFSVSWVQPVQAKPLDGTAVGIDEPAPGTTEPGTTESGATEPGTTETGTTEPGTTEPSTTEPETTESKTTEPVSP